MQTQIIMYLIALNVLMIIIGSCLFLYIKKTSKKLNMNELLSVIGVNIFMIVMGLSVLL